MENNNKKHAIRQRTLRDVDVERALQVGARVHGLAVHSILKLQNNRLRIAHCLSMLNETRLKAKHTGRERING